MTRTWLVVLAFVVALGGCAGGPNPRASADLGAPAAPRAAVTATPPVQPARESEQLARIVTELVELQNAVAKLMMSARQHDDQLLYLQRRVGELEVHTRARGATVPGFAGSAPAPAPAALPPPPVRPPQATLPPVTSRVAPSPAPLPAPSSPAEELYQAALAKHQSGDLDGAVVALYEVIANHADDPVRERAQLLIGDIFYAQKDYRGAVAELEGLLRAVPRGGHVPEALLKIGLAQRALGDETRARKSWEQLVKSYPTSAAARQARTLLKAPRG